MNLFLPWSEQYVSYIHDENKLIKKYISTHRLPWEYNNQTNEQSKETGNLGRTRRGKIKQKRNTICVGHHYMQAHTNNINKGNAKRRVSPYLKIWPGDLDLYPMTLKINRVSDALKD